MTWHTISFADDREERDILLPPDDIVVGWLALWHAIVDEGDRCTNCGLRAPMGHNTRYRNCYQYHRLHGVDRPSRLFKASTFRVRTVATEPELQAGMG